MPYPTLIPATRLAWLQAFSDANLPDTAVVMLPTTVEIPGGEQIVYSPATPSTRTLDCRVTQPTTVDLERFTAGQLVVKPTCMIAFEAGESIATNARINLSGITPTADGDVAWARTVDVIGDAGPLSVTMMRKYPARDV